MFTTFAQQGSFTALVLMEFASFMAFSIASDWQKDPYRLHTPGLVHQWIFIPFVFACIPLSIWLGVYIGWYEGWLGGVTGWVLVQIISTFVLRTILIKCRILYAPLAVLMIPACIAGYWISIKDIIG
ncbi:hypothetical protein [Kosakonia pseudosacchari]|uniref:hypothetical protein n=1 Tax=Kosakonia pseudosacchari TaxID=1646340 RepID=UPI0018826CAD|nr:hypothetical protein [Kosakonia pseudosacchari]QOV64013.1 hypothetical protein IP581_22745 [Kosakonia pseudosacchari]